MILYGSKKNQILRKIQRFASERGIRLDLRDTDDQPPKKGEIENLARALGGFEGLLDRNSREWKRLGMDHLEYDALESLMDHPGLLAQPIIRDGSKAWIISDDTDLSQILKKG